MTNLRVLDTVASLAKVLADNAGPCSVCGCDRPQVLQVICDTFNLDTGHRIVAPFAEAGVCRYHKGVENMPRQVVRNVLEAAYSGFGFAFGETVYDLPAFTVFWVCGGEIETIEPVDLVEFFSDPALAPNDAALVSDLPFRSSY